MIRFLSQGFQNIRPENRTEFLYILQKNGVNILRGSTTDKKVAARAIFFNSRKLNFSFWCNLTPNAGSFYIRPNFLLVILSVLKILNWPFHPIRRAHFCEKKYFYFLEIRIFDEKVDIPNGDQVWYWLKNRPIFEFFIAIFGKNIFTCFLTIFDKNISSTLD